MIQEFQKYLKLRSREAAVQQLSALGMIASGFSLMVAAPFAINSLKLSPDFSNFLKLSSPIVGGALGVAAFAKGNNLLNGEGEREIDRMALIDLYAAAIETKVNQSIGLLKTSPDEGLSSPLYDWDNISDEAVGFIVAGNSGSAKTSFAAWLLGKLTAAKPAQVMVLDPHFNDLWEQAGLNAINEIAEIERTLDHLITELDNRCTRKGLKQPLGEDLIILVDEINACRERFSSYKKIDSALRRLGSEGRKFGMTLIAINQSSNVNDLGISAPFRSNFVLILLGAAARKYSEEHWTKNNPDHAAMKSLIKGAAYPVVVSGAIEGCPALHPTHGSYTQWKKCGNPPKNLLPINQLPLMIGGGKLGDCRPSIDELRRERLALESSYKSQFLPPENDDSDDNFNAAIDPELERIILEFAADKGCIAASELRTARNRFKSFSSEEIKAMFAALASQNKGRFDGTKFSPPSHPPS